MDSSAGWLQRTTTDFTDQLLSTCVDNASSDAQEMSMKIRCIGFDIHFYSLSLFIIPVGVVCNLFSVCVFVTSPTFRSNSTAQFLIALSVTDCLVLVGDGLRCLSMRNPHHVYYTGLTFMHTSDFACKFINYWRERYYLFIRAMEGALQRGQSGPWPTQNFGWVGHNAFVPTNRLTGLFVNSQEN